MNNLLMFALLMQVNSAFMKKIPKGAEASNILVGEVDFLEKPLSAFIRLQEATILGDLTEVDVPTRFLFVLLGPFVSITFWQHIISCLSSFPGRNPEVP